LGSDANFMTMQRVFGVRAQIRQALGLPCGPVRRTAAKLVSDPNNPKGTMNLDSDPKNPQGSALAREVFSGKAHGNSCPGAIRCFGIFNADGGIVLVGNL